MSFRIDDILKKESSENEHQGMSVIGEGCDLHAAGAQGLLPWQRLAMNDCNSILEQTLMNSRSYGGFKQPCDLYSAKLLSSWYNCDKMSYMPVPYDAYVDKANPYMTAYPRRIWPLYSSIPIMMPYHYAHYSKRKGGQVRFTATQTDALEKRFNSNKYLSPEDRRLLAESLKLTDRQVKTWFQNRRAKWRRCNNTTTNNTDTCENQEDDSESETEICDTSQEIKQ